jgi:peroxiredoxin
MHTTESDHNNPRETDFSLRTWSCLALILGMLAVWFSGCVIEETPAPRSGSVHVTFIAGDTTLAGARIRVDGRVTPRVTPATLTGIPVGPRRVSAFLPGFVDTSLVVVVNENETTEAALVAARADGGTLELSNAPDGTVLLMNNIPLDTVPVEIETPTLFSNLGIGTFRFSAYLPGSATELPAQWTVTLAPRTPVTLTPIFTPVQTGNNEGDLAPVFQLASDWDQSPYRLQDYRGRVVLVSFFFYNCTACIEEFPYIAALYKDPRYEGRIEFLGVDFVDSYSQFARFREDHPALDITFPLLHAPGLSVKTAYGLVSCPANFIIDRTGRIRLIEQTIPEAELRQTVDQLLETSSLPEFSFSMRDTAKTYTDGTRSQEFDGLLKNQLGSPRNFIFTIDPVVFPDTSRETSICIGTNCILPRSGPISYTATSLPLATDTIRYSVYNYIAQWFEGENGWYSIPMDSALHGDYTLDVGITPEDNPSERIGYRLHLHDGQVSGVAHAAAGGTVSNWLSGSDIRH